MLTQRHGSPPGRRWEGNPRSSPSAAKLLIMLACLSMACARPTNSGAIGKTSAASPDTDDPPRIAAFNIQALSAGKISDPFVKSSLTAILAQFDLIFIQELRDNSNRVLPVLAEEVSSLTGVPYEAIVTDNFPEGPGYHEKYAYLYNTDVFALESVHVNEEICTKDCQQFLRQPFIASFSQRATSEALLLVGAHVRPSDAVQELTALGSLSDKLHDRLEFDHMLVLGDLNADCSYVSGTKLQDIRKRHFKNFTWYVEDTDDTTVSDRDCAYDRILMSPPLRAQIKPLKERVFRFDRFLGVGQERALEVSDHFPVYLEWQSRME